MEQLKIKSDVSGEKLNLDVLKNLERFKSIFKKLHVKDSTHEYELHAPFENEKHRLAAKSNIK